MELHLEYQIYCRQKTKKNKNGRNIALPKYWLDKQHFGFNSLSASVPAELASNSLTLGMPCGAHFVIKSNLTVFSVFSLNWIWTR